MNDTQLSVRIPADLAEAFAAVAEHNDRTVSGELRHIIRRHVRPKGANAFVTDQSQPITMRRKAA